MATRENQGLQIALILFVMITVVLALTTYLYFRKAEEARKETMTANTNLEKQRAERDTYYNAFQIVKRLVGKGDPQFQQSHYDDMAAKLEQGGSPIWADVKVILENYKKDMDTYAVGLPEDGRDYRLLPEVLLASIRDKNIFANDQLAKVQSVLKEKQTVEARETSRTQVALDKQEEFHQDLVAERQKYATELQRVRDEKGAITAERDKKLQEITLLADKSDKDTAAFTSQLNKMQQMVDAKNTQIQGMRKESFEVPDGKVTWVNQRSNLVWINLGSADGLPRQATFSVYNQDENNFAAAEKKGSVEVVRIIDPHLAEARILGDQLSNPILPGDHVYSPTWQPGTKVHFALAGFLDTDGDGKEDRNLVKNLISLNGGVIDAEVQADGRLLGALDINTRYLVVGDRPTEKSSAAMRDSFTLITREADRLGVEQLSVSKLLERMGYQGEEKTVTLGRGASSSDFSPRGSSGEQPANDGFRPRRPPARGEDGAF